MQLSPVLIVHVFGEEVVKVMGKWKIKREEDMIV